MIISPALIPHDQFHLGIWLVSVENPCWYYFMKRKNTNIISNDSFLESVDPPLQKLVQFLHEQGIRTTPSCSGHYKNIGEYKEIYAALRNDLQKIQHHGLALKDIETGRIYFYRNKHYRLPWVESIFIRQVMSYQQRGIIGIRLKNRVKIKQKILALDEQGICTMEKDHIIMILVEQENREKNLAAWNKITRKIQEIILSDLVKSGYMNAVNLK